MTQVAQIEKAFPKGEEVQLSTGAIHLVKPLKIGQIPKAVKLASGVASVILKSETQDPSQYANTLLALFTSGAEDLLELVSYGTGVERKEFDELDLDDAALLATAFVKVNQDFFVHRMIPLIGKALKKLPV